VSPHDGCIFTDIYHDTSGLLLLNAHVYVRQRNSEWQVKIRRTGDLVSTGCIEVSGEAHVESALRSEGFDVSLASLEAVATIETARSSWRVGKFTVSVDESLLLLDSHGAAGEKVVKIPHSVGEVELCEEADESNAGNRMKEMTQEIDDFMGRYEEVFKRRHDGHCQQIPEGKLGAYLRWQKMFQEQRFFPGSKWCDGKCRFV
jgi:hypothetical protein